MPLVPLLVPLVPLVAAVAVFATACRGKYWHVGLQALFVLWYSLD